MAPPFAAIRQFLFYKTTSCNYFHTKSYKNIRFSFFHTATNISRNASKFSKHHNGSYHFTRLTGVQGNLTNANTERRGAHAARAGGTRLQDRDWDRERRPPLSPVPPGLPPRCRRRSRRCRGTGTPAWVPRAPALLGPFSPASSPTFLSAGVDWSRKGSR